MAKSGIIPTTKQDSGRLASPPDVEVTEAMVKAGVREWFGVWDRDVDPPEQIVAAIFLAMQKARQ